MKDHKNYTYFHSKALDLDYCYAKDESHLWTSDRVKYDRSEIEQLKKIGMIDKQTHMVKSIFEGKIIECIPPAAPKAVASVDIF